MVDDLPNSVFLKLTFAIKELNRLRLSNVGIHILIWGLLFTLPHLLIDVRKPPAGSFPGSWFFITNLYNVGLFYLSAFYLYPKFFNKTWWWLFICSLAVLLPVSYYLKLYFTTEFYPDVILDKGAYRVIFFPQIVFIIAAIIYRLILDSIRNEKRQKELLAEQLTIKLKFLRSQISPHFIFNVLTNLVSLARKGSKEMEPSLIILADLMRYMLYESDEEKVPVFSEIEYLQNYIGLQKLRFGDDIRIDFQCNTDDETLQRKIEPMLLIPFVENAFKHSSGAHEPFIFVSIHAASGVLTFEVKNKFVVLDESKDRDSGIGLENVQTRLKLLYENKYQLHIADTENIFSVFFKLPLSE